MDFLLDFILHIDQYMIDIVQEYHTWTYVILFLIIFCETGLVVIPFLPGDSLLFVAGMGSMHYYYFMLYNLIGGALWIAIFCYAGYFFGDLPFVQENLKLLIVAIIAVSVLPAAVEVVRARLKSRK